MQKILEQIPNNFFGPVTNKIIKELIQNRRCTIYSMFAEEGLMFETLVKRTLLNKTEGQNDYAIEQKLFAEYTKHDHEDQKSTFFVPFLHHTAVEQLIKIYNSQLNAQIPLPLSKKILFLCGGNLTLLKIICRLIAEHNESVIQTSKTLLSFNTVISYFHTVAEIIAKQPFDHLLQMGLINANGTGFTHLLKKFLDTYELTYLRSLFTKLSDTDIKILSFLIQNPGNPVDKEQLALILDQPLNGEADWAIYKAVERLKPKIKNTFTIKTVKGKGWKLISK